MPATERAIQLTSMVRHARNWRGGCRVRLLSLIDTGSEYCDGQREGPGRRFGGNLLAESLHRGPCTSCAGMHNKKARLCRTRVGWMPTMRSSLKLPDLLDRAARRSAGSLANSASALAMVGDSTSFEPGGHGVGQWLLAHATRQLTCAPRPDRAHEQPATATIDANAPEPSRFGRS